MREIKFRGKRTDTGEWIYGDLIKNSIIDPFTYIQFGVGYKVDNPEIGKPIKVYPHTVGQLTNIRDKNFKEIYEGDVCNCKEWYFGDHKEIEFNGMVCFDDGQFAIIRQADSSFSLYQELDSCAVVNRDIEIIGNFTDNPELLNE